MIHTDTLYMLTVYRAVLANAENHVAAALGVDPPGPNIHLIYGW